MDDDAMRLEQFAWLLDCDDQCRNSLRLKILWHWADELAQLQREANSTGKPIKYYQRGTILRTLYPTNEAM